MMVDATCTNGGWELRFQVSRLVAKSSTKSGLTDVSEKKENVILTYSLKWTRRDIYTCCVNIDFVFVCGYRLPNGNKICPGSLGCWATGVFSFFLHIWVLRAKSEKKTLSYYTLYMGSCLCSTMLCSCLFFRVLPSATILLLNLSLWYSRWQGIWWSLWVRGNCACLSWCPAWALCSLACCKGVVFQSFNCLRRSAHVALEFAFFS